MPKGRGRSVSPAGRGGRGGRGGGRRPTSPKMAAKAAAAAPAAAASASTADDLPPPIGYLISCDVPTKQYITYLNVLKEPADKKFILQDLDTTHLLVKAKFKDEIMQQVEAWEDSNVYSAVEKVGEDFDMS